MASNTMITAHGAPPPTGPYAPAILASGSQVLNISGQIADAPDGSIAGLGDAEEQARQCLRNLDGLLRAAGASRTDVVKIGVFLTDIADRAAVARARTEFFGDHKPAATLFQVGALVLPELKVEIDAVAVF